MMLRSYTIANWLTKEARATPEENRRALDRCRARGASASDHFLFSWPRAIDEIVGRAPRKNRFHVQKKIDAKFFQLYIQ
jgi:hypothetical protein